jgi:hypothetical protein
MTPVRGGGGERSSSGADCSILDASWIAVGGDVRDFGVLRELVEKAWWRRRRVIARR